jgi:hypothetical protein
MRLALKYTGTYDRLCEPDLVIAPDGAPYLYRWHVIPRNSEANVYFHIQVSDDPERPLHDHPWDNTSVILSGGYDEILQRRPPYDRVETVRRSEGQVIHRAAEEAHRLLLRSVDGYTMTQFTTGPKRRDWGFWCLDKFKVLHWVNQTDLITTDADGVSTFKEELVHG